jgi:hypothetical protein
MCEINPKHSAFFKLEAFTSNPDMSKEEFTNEVMMRLFAVEQTLNMDGRFRFHIHEDTPRERAARKPNAGATK